MYDKDINNDSSSTVSQQRGANISVPINQIICKNINNYKNININV